MNKYAQLVSTVSVIDLDSNAPVEVCIYKDKQSGGMFGVDLSFIQAATTDDLFVEPFNGDSVALIDIEPFIYFVNGEKQCVYLGKDDNKYFVKCSGVLSALNQYHDFYDEAEECMNRIVICLKAWLSINKHNAHKQDEELVAVKDIAEFPIICKLVDQSSLSV